MTLGITLTEGEYRTIDSIIAQCNAMLSKDALAKIYTVGKQTRGAGLVVEVGTGHGSGTIALGLGLLANNPTFRLITFDKIIGGSREQFGDFDHNVKVIRDNLAKFGLQDHVTPYFCSVESGISDVPEGEIDILMIDADGLIDREFLLFYHRVKEGGAIILDDSLGDLQVRARSFTFMKKSLVAGKRRVTEVLASEFERQGLIAQFDAAGHTRFFRKPAGAPATIDLRWVIEAYRRLLPSPVSLTGGRIAFVVPGPPRFLVRLIRG